MYSILFWDGLRHFVQLRGDSQNFLSTQGGEEGMKLGGMQLPGIHLHIHVLGFIFQKNLNFLSIKYQQVDFCYLLLHTNLKFVYAHHMPYYVH